MGLKAWIKRLFNPECDHIFYPKYDAADGTPLGQECKICGHINWLDEDTTKPQGKRNP